MTARRRYKIGEGFSEQTVIAYAIKDLSRKELTALLQSVVSRRKFKSLLVALEQQFTPLVQPEERNPVVGSVPDYALRVLKFASLAGKTIDDHNAELASLARAFDDRAAELASRVHLIDDIVAEFASNDIDAELASRVRKAIGDSDRAARWGFALGLLVREFELKIDFEPAAMTGVKVRDGRDKGRIEANQKKHEAAVERYKQWQMWANPIWRKRPRLSETVVAGIIKERHGIGYSVRTIRGYIEKPGKAR